MEKRTVRRMESEMTREMIEKTHLLFIVRNVPKALKGFA